MASRGAALQEGVREQQRCVQWSCPIVSLDATYLRETVKIHFLYTFVTLLNL